YLVYPGATHDRFSHAIGAMHVAGRMWEQVCATSGHVVRKHFSDEDIAYFRRIVRLAALMHDLGHPPFSHVSEQFMPAFSVLELPRDWFVDADTQRQATHEDYSILMVAELGKSDESPLSWDDARNVASLIHHGVTPSPSWADMFGTREDGKGGIHRLLRSLISGELDCDRMDYLLRDAYYTGVAYGAHDIDHLITNLGVVEVDDGSLVRTIDSTAVRAFEDFLLARYHMFIQVYMHKTTIAFDGFLERAIEAGEFSMEMPGDAEGYLDLRDSTIIERLYTAAKDTKNAWSRRLASRTPPKLIFTSFNKDPEDKAKMQELADALKEHDIDYSQITSHQYLSKTTPGVPSDVTDTAMLVRRKMLGKHVYEPIEKYSSLLNKYNEVIDSTNLYVLPEDYEATKIVIDRMGKVIPKKVF
ncbi:HD domain-containing protein, partial [Patescibacteria group bacterium]